VSDVSNVSDVTCAASAKSFSACLLAKTQSEEEGAATESLPWKVLPAWRDQNIFAFPQLKTHVFVYSGVSLCQQVPLFLAAGASLLWTYPTCNSFQHQHLL
jgi:hypothetical protein